MLFIILTDNFPNALKFFFCILLMQIERFGLMKRIHANQCANNGDTKRLSSKVRVLAPGHSDVTRRSACRWQQRTRY